MTWIVIALVLLMAFGPVLWLVPSKRDRRLARLRTEARQEGLSVEIRQIPKTNPSAAERVSAGGEIRDPVRTCAAYVLTLQHKLRYLPSGRRRYADGASEGPFPHWIFAPKPEQSASGGSYLEDMLRAVTPTLQAVAPDVIGFEVGNRTLLFYYRENADSGLTVAGLATEMRGIESRLRALEEKISEQMMSEDS